MESLAVLIQKLPLPFQLWRGFCSFPLKKLHFYFMKIENIEKYNKDKIKEVDENNKRVMEKIQKNIELETEYRVKDVVSTISCKKVSFTINWREGQYEKIFNHS